jgi:hypothetical protein
VVNRPLRHVLGFLAFCALGLLIGVSYAALYNVAVTR